MEVVIVRHGQTAWNVAEVFRGRADIGLDSTGMQQAQMLGAYLSRRELEAVYSSPLKRALQTAEAVTGRHSLAVATAPGLADMDFGEWQGVSQDEVKRAHPDLYDRWMTEPHPGHSARRRELAGRP
jgi:broad specificity phosphatase PhoE